MDFSKKRLTIEEAKKMDLVDYLSTLGHEPSKIRGNSYWYSSPLHEEHTPSFTVNRHRNVWYDFGLGKGGSIIDFGVLYNKLTIPEFLQMLSDGNALSAGSGKHQQNVKAEKESKLKITGTSAISSPPLSGYLEGRGIPANIADRYCLEVRFEAAGKNYYGIGFKNDAGGFEIRNPYFKGSSSPKEITTFKNGTGNLTVFEGFFDFLSYQALKEKIPEHKSDYLVLNSLSFFEKSLPLMDSYKSIHLYLDNNSAGRKCTEQTLAMGSKYQDESRLYHGHEDLNDFLLSGKGLKPKIQRKGLRPH